MFTMREFKKRRKWKVKTGEEIGEQKTGSRYSQEIHFNLAKQSKQ